MDIDLARQDHLDAVEELMKAHSNIGAIVMECTNMSPFAADIRKKFQVPVFNIYTFIEFFFIIFILIIFGAITQSAIGIGFGIPACFLVLLEPSMVPSCIVLMGSFLAFSNAMLSFKDIIKVDLIYAYSGRVVGSLLAMPLIFLTLGTNKYLIVFGVLLLIATYTSAKKWDIVATKKNIAIAGTASGLMGTLTGIGGPPMAIVYQNSSARKVVATLNMFFGIGALFSVILFIYFDLINLL